MSLYQRVSAAIILRQAQQRCRQRPIGGWVSHRSSRPPHPHPAHPHPTAPRAARLPALPCVYACAPAGACARKHARSHIDLGSQMCMDACLRMRTHASIYYVIIEYFESIHLLARTCGTFLGACGWFAWRDEAISGSRTARHVLEQRLWQ